MGEDRETRKRQITLLVETYYQEFEFLHNIPLNELITKALDKYLDSNLTISEINEEIAKAILKMREDNSKKNDIQSISNNHKIIYSKLEELTKALNAEGVDYQLAGALCGYIKYGKESDRCHEDIDISINEKDIPKFKKVCESMGLGFSDDRFNSPRVLNSKGIPTGEHEIIARDSNSNFHIGAFAFERLADGTVITKGYYHDSNNNPCCREDVISRDLAGLIFSKETVDFKGIPLYITSPEYIYDLKSYTKSEKDLKDMEFLEDKIDKDKLNKIRELSKTDKSSKNNLVTNIPTEEKKEDKAELQEMLYTTTDLEKDMIKAHTRQFKKINPNTKVKIKTNETGSISIVSIILALLIVFGVILIGLILYTIMR